VTPDREASSIAEIHVAAELCQNVAVMWHDHAIIGAEFPAYRRRIDDFAYWFKIGHV
jgi:hypothetical protein